MELTVAAIPIYFGSMGAEYLWLRKNAAERGATAGDYEWRDTLASLTMGSASLVAPVVVPRLLRQVTPGRGRYAKALVAVALGGAAVATVAGRRLRYQTRETNRAERRTLGMGALDEQAVDEQAPDKRALRKIAGSAAVAAVVAGGVATTTAWTTRTTAQRFWRNRRVPNVGTGPLALAAAVLVWDFVYYWNHRAMHESRYMWAIHVVHHSSEHYNLSTALRQPVADALGTFLPQGALCMAGFDPGLVASARSINLLYQFFIHTETVGRLGPLERFLNTPSHHRVHHGSNPQYIDRNHGSILILWDRLFGTFEPEAERVVYGLTRNIDTFNPLRIATHEYRDMLADVYRSTDWIERLSYVVRGPGWAYRRRARDASTDDSASEDAPTEGHAAAQMAGEVVSAAPAASA